MTKWLRTWNRSADRDPGSAGCQPALFGSLPKSLRISDVVGKLPTTAG